jgi:hypothetical protein
MGASRSTSIFSSPCPGSGTSPSPSLPAIYRNRIREEGADLAVVKDVAVGLAGAPALEIRRDRRGRLVSPAEQFSLITTFLARSTRAGTVPTLVEVGEILGPSERPPATETAELSGPAFRDALLDAFDEMRGRAQVPSRVFAGVKKVAPGAWLRASASVALAAIEAGPAARPVLPAKIAIPTGTLATERYVAEDTPALFGGWIIHPEGFRAPRIVEMAKLQAWTLKPAER